MKKLFFLCAAALLMTSCATVSTPCGIAGLYTSVKTGSSISSNNLGTKVGTSSATNILGLFATGDAGVNIAARNAGITKISHVDTQKTSVLGLFTTYKTFVYGE